MTRDPEWLSPEAYDTSQACVQDSVHKVSNSAKAAFPYSPGLPSAVRQKSNLLHARDTDH